jgi:Type VI secretion system/phage-baseplate injector OB domain
MESLNKAYLDGKYFIGRVVDNDDPDREGRCRVEVFGMFDGLAADELPWAAPGGRTMFAGGDGGFADISIPKINSFVQVRFVEGDIYNMEYVAIQNINPAVQAEIEGSYLNSHVLAYDNDEELKVFYTPAKGVEIYLKRSHITINPDASITIEHADSESIIELVGPNINITANSSVNITANSLIRGESTEVAMNGTSVTKLGPAPTYSAVLAEPLWTFLKSLAAAVDGKLPSTPGVFAGQAAAAEQLATSKNVKVSA